VVAVVIAIMLAVGGVANDGPAPADGLDLRDVRVALAPVGHWVARAVRLPGALPLPSLPSFPFPALPLPVVPFLPASPPPEPPTEVGARRRRRRRTASIHDLLVIYVPGHGGDPEGFRDLARRMGLRPEQVRVFDYRMAGPWDDRIAASKEVTVDDAAAVLDVLVRREASRNDRIYLVGHSKGGAVLAMVLAGWDAGTTPVPDAVVGAALLDPPISSGWLGRLQRLGRYVADVPDNGGFDPLECEGDVCRDVRAGLGARAGVPVVVVRNRHALVTNFLDRPPGLRVYDVRESPWRRFRPQFPPGEEIWAAHTSMLHDDDTAACLAAEATAPGTCRWPRERGPRGSRAR